MSTLAAIFINASAAFGLPSGLLEAVCYVESSHNTDVISHNDGGSNSYGLCQIKLKTAQYMGFQGTSEELMQPEVNAYYAAAYLSYQLSRYKSIPRALVAYNKGNAIGLTRSMYSDKVINKWNTLNTKRTLADVNH